MRLSFELLALIAPGFARLGRSGGGAPHPPRGRSAAVLFVGDGVLDVPRKPGGVPNCRSSARSCFVRSGRRAGCEAPACKNLQPVKGGGRKRPALRRMVTGCGFARDRQYHRCVLPGRRGRRPLRWVRRGFAGENADSRCVLPGAMWASRPTGCGSFIRRGRRPRRPPQAGGCQIAGLRRDRVLSDPDVGRVAKRPPVKTCNR